MKKQKKVTVGLQTRSLKEVIAEFTPMPRPGRFFVVPIKEKFLRKKSESRIELIGKTVPTDVKTLDRIYYDHPYQFQVVAVGSDLDNGPEYKEKMILKKGDIIAINPWDSKRPPQAIIFEGHGFVELTLSFVLAILGNDQTFKKVI